MKIWIFYKLKCNILLRRHLLNLLLLFFSPKNKFIVDLSQNLDKYIVLCQKELISSHNNKQYDSKCVKEKVA